MEVKEGRVCSDGVIEKHYALGKELGIPGTPMDCDGRLARPLGDTWRRRSWFAALESNPKNSDSRPVSDRR